MAQPRHRRADRAARPRHPGELYATGLRRLEIVRLKLFDLQLDRGLILVSQGKGKKDRYVPIGERAAAWLQQVHRARRVLSSPSSRTTSRCSLRRTASRSAATI